MIDLNTYLENIPKFEEFNFWFIRKSANEFYYDMRSEFHTEGFEPTGIVTEDDIVACDPNVVLDFEKFKNRPEYYVGLPVQLNTQSITANNTETMIDLFETIIVGVQFIRAFKAKRNPEEGFASVSRFLNWIRSTDFYTCPGSSKFHDAEPSGLLFHSLNVYNNILDMKTLPKFKDVPYESAALVSLCHDFTKIGNYESYMRNVKNEQTGVWEQVPSYRWKCNPFPFGHGVASMYITIQFFRLNVEEMLAIRWHMGEYNVSDRECGELEDAAEQYPLVRMVQFADQLACVKY